MGVLKRLKYTDLLTELVKREIKGRYKQSILGYAWVMLVPLLNLTILTLVFSYFVRIQTGNIPYPLFLFVGLIPWTFTANSIIFSTSSLVNNRSLLTKIYSPSEVFPASVVTTRLIDFLLTVLLGLVLAVFLRIDIYPSVIYIPVILAVQILLTLGISFILSSLNVFFRDIENIIGVFITMWMYLSPVIYPPELIPTKFLSFYNLNPITPILNAYRNVVLYNVPPSWPSFGYSVLVSLFLFFAGLLFFRNRAKYFADVV